MEKAKPVRLLCIFNCPSTFEEKEVIMHVPYASAAGSLMYAMVCTRPDIAHAWLADFSQIQVKNIGMQ